MQIGKDMQMIFDSVDPVRNTIPIPDNTGGFTRATPTVSERFSYFLYIYVLIKTQGNIFLHFCLKFDRQLTISLCLSLFLLPICLFLS
jgi:hypothetical protein